MSDLTGAYDPAWESMFSCSKNVEASSNEVRNTQTNVATVSVRELRKHGLFLSFDWNAKVKDARGLRNLLNVLVPEETTSFYSDFETHRGRDTLATLRREWVRDWKRLDPRTSRFVFKFCLTYPSSADPLAASNAAESFVCRLVEDQTYGAFKYVLVHQQNSDQKCSTLVVSRALRGRKTLILAEFPIAHVRRHFLVTASEVGAVL